MPADIINGLGFKFDEAFDVKGRLSISDLFPKSKKRCGIYLLNFSNNTFYIGQAIDIVKRFSQHRKNYDNINRYWFIEIKKDNLNEFEERLIKSAEAAGLLIINKTFVSNVIGDTDLDLLITVEQQNKWLEKNEMISNEGFDIYPNIDIKYKIKYQHNFEKLKQNENYTQLKRILKKYIEKCIPAYKKTELSFWALSCLPSTNKGTYPRFFCININAMEVFVLGYAKTEKKYFCFIICSGRFLYESKDWVFEKEVDRIKTSYTSLSINESDYRAAGSDQYRINFEDLDEFERFYDSESIFIESIKEMNLRLMRKGGTIYSHFHCFDLAKDMVY